MIYVFQIVDEAFHMKDAVLISSLELRPIHSRPIWRPGRDPTTTVLSMGAASEFQECYPRAGLTSPSLKTRAELLQALLRGCRPKICGGRPRRKSTSPRFVELLRISIVAGMVPSSNANVLDYANLIPLLCNALSNGANDLIYLA